MTDVGKAQKLLALNYNNEDFKNDFFSIIVIFTFFEICRAKSNVKTRDKEKKMTQGKNIRPETSWKERKKLTNLAVF